jgi:predicted PolB exonuclease-like 3'-5' exonuclease
MINIPISKILFLDIETVGCCPDFEVCQNLNPHMADQFDKYFDWFLKRFPEDYSPTKLDIVLKNEVFKKRAGLVPEFAKIICVCVAFVTDNGEVKKQIFSGDDEKELLEGVQKLLDRCGKLNFFLCGHNLKNFDIPMLAKRMIINGLMPPSILPSYDTKPWEIKAIDTKEIWQYGSYTSVGSLDLLCSCLDIPSSKEGEITGDKVHESYWNEQKLTEISEYCERDVLVLIDVIKKLKNLKK